VVINSTEGCLSLGKKEYTVERNTSITIKYYDMHYQRETLRLDGIDAIVAQHEIDHLDGILISDKVMV
jgi:peptide deformylase